MKNDQAETKPKNYLKAIRLINIEDGKCDFEIGKIPVRQHINVNYFFAQTEVDAYEKVPHPAPRRQYVITLKGKLRFKVSNGNTFIIEPGTILIANDTMGSGHTWEILDGDEWERLYIPLETDADDYFVLD
ncbi:hypothetical protein ACFOG5_08260 [Pedobacter fastidiosus]|uniref:AraC-type arabinose-binding/dimerisation domain-containing protein n=1 Tax=Pedobacter fastidiosus TaxID=2765361 RepID=A0ABR7KQ29_9SPHI|nr:hypothetical protein [Pedobacter fastidiosus]MBC6109852.1 hypothetical protein [Pedobacter fastidiosus]